MTNAFSGLSPSTIRPNGPRRRKWERCLVWTAIEILFDLAGEREKTKAICRALSDYVAADQPDRDRAYQVIQNLYFKRGQTVHAGRSMAQQDVFESFRLASVAFQRILIEGRLPPSPSETVH